MRTHLENQLWHARLGREDILHAVSTHVEKLDPKLYPGKDDAVRKLKAIAEELDALKTAIEIEGRSV